MLRSRALAALVVAAAAISVPADAGAQNRALGRPAFSSSVFSNYTPDQAVDGSNLWTIGTQEGFSTNFTDDPWWYVDLGADYDLSTLTFWNRYDCCSTRIVGAVLGLFTAAPYQAGSPAPVESWTFASSQREQQIVSTTGAVGRYVGIRIPTLRTSSETLNFAELEVYGTLVTPSATVPEPSTVVLLAGGLLTLAGVAVRRRAS